MEFSEKNSQSALVQLREQTVLEHQKKQAVTVVEESQPVEAEPRRIYTKQEILPDVVRYFGGDELAAGVWIDKYALKNKNGELMERTPEDMHRRMAREFARIERRYIHPLSEEEIFSLFDHFKYIIPQGSPMAGIGNNDQIVSLSNCFVIGNSGNSDSYGGIIRMDEEQVQLMKRRGGVGHDLSDIRPSGSHVQNCALTSTGVVPFMERFSNSTREVAQDGRRGALMLTISIKHPDSEKFIDAKMTQGKVTGANVSVRIDDDFMKSVQNKTPYIQQYPIESPNPKVTQEVDASKLWDKIIHNAWKSAEPGVLFWDTITRESVPDCYADEGFKTISTNPCGEIPLCPYDSCRLIAMNLYSYVEDPFTENAHFNMPLFRQHVQYAQRLMDDIIDLELEKIDRILEKIESDPEDDDLKTVERNLWLKIRNQSLKGRRTGLGITAEGDMLAALNIRYGSDEGNAFSTEIHKQLALAAYRSSVNMAKERGAFPAYSCIKEGHNPFIQRIRKADPKLYDDMVRYGRRNIALLTIAPTGSVSICTQTTSGIEPAFNVVYKRRRKINPNDINISKSIVKDSMGDQFEEYMVFHQKFVIWAETKGYTLEQMQQMDEKEIMSLVEQSPYYKSTAADTDYLKKVELQGSVQKWVDHSISVTVNLPSDISEQTVADLYMKAWQCGCKGLTVYREGSRDGVLNSITPKKEEKQAPKNFKRPKELQADIIHFKNNNEDWVAYIGLYNGHPYEIFTGKTGDEHFLLPKWVEHGIIIKNRHEDGSKTYDFKYYDKAGYEVLLRGLDRCFDQEFWNYAKFTSALLRNGIPILNIVNIISSLNFRQESINSWRNGVCRALKKFIQDGTKQKGVVCPKCEQKDTMEFKEGCLVCSNCGYSKCGS
ncbi:MAG: adenosylcobalamin-dependent ribonucleoside-diphosphate reductase [Bacteroidales bacterium]|nr:adenosylcobalamin-dependent ribonucleoside-diphosphate reductase [Bacteroidales bacterium]